jgi:cytochrome c-type protein NapB
MKTITITMVLAVAVTWQAPLAYAVDSLRGADLTSESVKAGRVRYETVKGGFGRSYREQPPMVPHEVDKYPLDLTTNGCLKCHDKTTYEKEKAPKIGDSHFLDRDGKMLETVSSRRYFCNQCHVPQAKSDALIANQFEGRK